MTTPEIVSLVKDVGVPVAMLIWFALRVERKLDEAKAAQEENTKVMHEGQLESARQLARVAAAIEQVDDHLDGRSTPPMGTKLVEGLK